MSWAGLSVSAAPAEGIEKIAAYAGTWTSRIEHFDTPYGKAGIDVSTLHNDCWRSGGFYACHQIVNGKSTALLVFTYNAKDDLYTSITIPSGGGETGSGTLRISGAVWTYPWELRDGAKTIQFRVVNVFHGPDRIEFRQEYSTDGEHWMLMGKGEERKID